MAEEGLMEAARIKVTIRCNLCGEKFVLRGRREKNSVDTGFKQCICNNANDLEIEEHSVL
jgi:formylmethanofuran dehydrogenase subunit E